MKAPCKKCWQRREVTEAKDGYLYCVVCNPDLDVDDFMGGFMSGLFGKRLKR